jgi:hypothetical protein
MGLLANVLIFEALCEAATVHPSVALENENLCRALDRRAWDEVERLLETEF